MNELMVFVEMINNEWLRKMVIYALTKAPKYFWIVPASSTGKYHPYYDSGIGGLVRHTVMTIKVGLDLVRSEMFIEDTQRNRDIVIIAIMFHDILKNGKEDSGNTVHEHPLLSSEFITNILLDNSNESLDNIEDINDISNCIKTHMGKWTTNKYSQYELVKPNTEIEKLVHMADYMSSRKYTLYMPSVD